jgi:hypothetical protein
LLLGVLVPSTLLLLLWLPLLLLMVLLVVKGFLQC